MVHVTSIVQRVVKVLHPGAVGLIGHHHGQERLEAACNLVYDAKAYLANAEAGAEASTIVAPEIILVRLDSGDGALFVNGDALYTQDAGVGGTTPREIGESLARALFVEMREVSMVVPSDDDWCWNDVYEVLPPAGVVKTKSAFVLVQEGGSSTELYLHGWDSQCEAERDRVDCTEQGSYRTSPVVEVPGDLAAHPAFYVVVQSILEASRNLDYVQADGAV